MKVDAVLSPSSALVSPAEIANLYHAKHTTSVMKKASVHSLLGPKTLRQTG